MHSIHCGSAIFQYQALAKRPAQETLIDCVGLHNKTNSKALNIHRVYAPHVEGGSKFTHKKWGGGE
jgi:hypothetical protein